MSRNRAQLPTNIVTRAYKPGGEAKVVNFLNLCYGAWGDMHKWQKLYAEYPTFDKSNVFIMEGNGEIIGHRGLHFRNIVVQQNRKVSTVSLCDTAIHSLYRGRGLYASLHQITLQAAKLQGASLAFAWNLKGSTTYNHNKKTGFAEIRRAPIYIKVIKPEKLLRSGLFNFIHGNEKLRKALQDLGSDLHFRIGKSEFSAGELIDKANEEPLKIQERIEIIFGESSLTSLANFRSLGKFQRIETLVLLLLFRKVKLRVSSFGVFLKLLGKGVRLLVSL